MSGSEGWGGTATLRSDPTDWLAIYGSASFSRFMTTFDALAVPDTVTLPANSPNNPFVGAVQVSFPTLNGFGQREARSDTIQAIGGAIVSLPWKWKAYFDVNQSWGRASVDDTGRQLTANYFRNLTELGLVNVLVDTIANPIDFQFDPDRMGTVRPPSKSEFNSYTLKFAGPLDFAKLPGGVPVVTLVAEQSRQWFGDSVVYVDGPSNAVVSYSPERSQKNRSAYGELVMPIIGPANNIPFINQFELHLAGRYDSYKGRGTNSSFTCVNHTGNLTAAELASPCPAPGVKIPYRTVKNDTFNPVIAAKWNIVPDLALRGSYSTGYTPPFLNNVLETPGIAVLGYTSAVVVSALDPLRNNERIGNSLLGSQTYLIEGLSGGNPNVDPQRSTSWSFGTILEPQRIPGLTLRADWTRITINNAYFSPNSLLTRTTPEERASFNDFMAAYPERFVRAAPGPGETVGKIIYIDATTANLSYKRSESLDFSADLITQVAGGTLRVHGNLSYLLKLESRLTPSAKTQNLKGVVSTADIFGLGDSLEYRGTPMSITRETTGAWAVPCDTSAAIMSMQIAQCRQIRARRGYPARHCSTCLDRGRFSRPPRSPAASAISLTSARRST